MEQPAESVAPPDMPLVLMCGSGSRLDKRRLLLERAVWPMRVVVGDVLAQHALEMRARDGHLPYSLMLKIVGPAMKSSLLPGRRDALIAELKKNDPRFLRRQTRLYLEYLDRYGSLAQRFADSGVPAWVVFGERGDVGITDEERVVLERNPRVRIVEIPETGHFALNQKPGNIATIVLEAINATAEHRSAPNLAS